MTNELLLLDAWVMTIGSGEKVVRKLVKKSWNRSCLSKCLFEL